MIVKVCPHCVLFEVLTSLAADDHLPLDDLFYGLGAALGNLMNIADEEQRANVSADMIKQIMEGFANTVKGIDITIDRDENQPEKLHS